MRRSNYHEFIGDMNKLSRLCKCLNKTQYMEIDIIHKITMHQCPDPVQQFIGRVLALSQSDHPTSVILESKLKE